MAEGTVCSRNVSRLEEVFPVEGEALDVVRVCDDVGGAQVRLEQRLLAEVVAAAQSADLVLATV